jgi:hypothetical protein
MKLQAKGDYVFFRAEKQSESGIITIKTGEYKEKEEWLKTVPLIVISIGEKVERVKIGDRILVGASTKTGRHDQLATILEGGESENVIYFSAKEEDISAVLE